MRFNPGFLLSHIGALLGLTAKNNSIAVASAVPGNALIEHGGNTRGSGGHRYGRGSGRRPGEPKGGISGAGLWRKCRASGRVRGH